MPAPELNPQTPGDLTANTALVPETPAPALYVAKHNGGRRFVVADADGNKVGDFVGTKETIGAEVDRLNAGGEPLVLDPQRINESKPAAKSKPSGIDPSTIKQPVLTEDGWLCPVPPVKE